MQQLPSDLSEKLREIISGIMNQAKPELTPHQANLVATVNGLTEFTNKFHEANPNIEGYEVLESLQVFSLHQIMASYPNEGAYNEAEKAANEMRNKIHAFIKELMNADLASGQSDPRIMVMAILQLAGSAMHSFEVVKSVDNSIKDFLSKLTMPKAATDPTPSSSSPASEAPPCSCGHCQSSQTPAQPSNLPPNLAEMLKNCVVVDISELMNENRKNPFKLH